MTVKIISTDQIQVTLSADDTLFLTQGITVANPVSSGIVTTAFDADNTTLKIDGSVFGFLHGIDLVSTDAGNDLTGVGSHNLAIGATGSVTGATNHGITLLGTENVVSNYGEITGLVDLGAGLAQDGDDISIQNFGSITGDYGIFLAGSGGDSTIVNAGTISGRTAAIAVNIQAITLTNTGLITAEVDLGGIAIAISDGSLGASFITNSGTIIGDVIGASDRSLAVFNSGFISGLVRMGDTSDLYDGRGGTVTAGVFGGGGDDTYIVDNAAIKIEELAGEGFDTVKSSVSFVLGEFFEYLTLTGAGDVNATGNDLSNTIKGNAGDNILRGGEGIDTVHGGKGDDDLRGGLGDDSLQGGAGNDLLRGGQDGDTLKGGNGDDILIGGAGKDKLIGGGGDDVFRFNKAAHSQNNASADQIRGFAQGEDVIDLMGLAQAGLEFIGATGFSGTGTGEVRVTTAGANAVVRVDVDGDGSADMRILVTGLTTLAETDFLL